MSCLEHVKDNIKTVHEFRKLDNNQKEMIEQVKKILLRTNSIPCTYCDYCTVRCPQEIPIPKYFSVYNNKMQCNANQLLHTIYYDNYARKYARASACISCYECEKVCPQKIDIVDNLEKIAELLEK
ncbi:4Fe-4S dicluster domain-containing protein [Methanosphaera sp. ISO3-F5]|uniref:4Fe-4S dicluster domain-containing protein n=1 Tax=Methanosphaera sp. ISO3-F5 TaxID=1452353 RepID=UPI002B257B8E|nr:4Fe-4S dicluster domain-containing protein [Methanosphaera sp. ISO3-F5]WQH63629.1 4Fe-4S dicluster domain-containing protein [Methanosphaera sp. ISO3-F5]